jgi:hypothetical protein
MKMPWRLRQFKSRTFLACALVLSVVIPVLTLPDAASAGVAGGCQPTFATVASNQSVGLNFLSDSAASVVQPVLSVGRGHTVAYGSIDAADDLDTAYWPAEGTADDASGDCDGTLRGDASFATGFLGQAFMLDGDRDWIEVADTPDLDVGTGDFTACLWVNYEETQGEQILIEKFVETENEATREGWSLTKMPENSIRLQAPVSRLESEAIDIQPGVWTHVAVRRSAGVCTIFVDGVNVVAGSCAESLDTSASLKLGHRGNPTDTSGSVDERDFWCHGRLDEVHLWVGSALSDGEIYDLAHPADATPPTTIDDASAGWQPGAVTVRLTPTDSGSGMSGGSAKTEYKLDAVAIWSIGTSVAVSGDGVHTIVYRSTDAAGNLETPDKSCTVRIDATKPSTTASGADSLWHTAAVTVTLAATDTEGGSGMSGGSATTEYKLDDAATWTTGISVTVPALADHSGDGTHAVSYRSSDASGNLEETKSVTVKIDTTGPTTAGKAAEGKRREALALAYCVSDRLSPQATNVRLVVTSAKGKKVKSFTLGIKKTATWYSVNWKPKAKGSYRYVVTAKDLAGNKQAKIGGGTVRVR